jgi:hypothetical protein
MVALLGVGVAAYIGFLAVMRHDTLKFQEEIKGNTQERLDTLLAEHGEKGEPSTG